jgi:dimethylamine--corrinoid protein Co-methyltransferase
VGGSFDRAVAHGIISGIGGIRDAGDLAARMQVAEGMRIGQAKGYVASKTGVSVEEISAPVVMNEWRKGLDLGRVRRRTGSG